MFKTWCASIHWLDEGIIAKGVAMPSILADMFVRFVMANIGAALAMLLKQPAVVGQIVAGLLVGSLVIALASHPATPDETTQTAHRRLSNLGAVILLLTVGFEFRVRQLLGWPVAPPSSAASR